MTRRLAAAVALALAAGAAWGCRPLEYAELDAMRPNQLLALRCQYQAEIYQWVGIASENSAGVSQARPQLDLARGNRCAQELERLDRLLGRKLSLPGDDRAVSLRVTEMCAAKK